MTLGIDKAVEARKVPSEGWPVAPSIDPGSFLYAPLHMALSRRLVPDFHWNSRVAFSWVILNTGST
jgi:hypothetical protein